MELRGEIRAQFALTPEEAAELLLAIGRTSASASALTESETGRNRREQDATLGAAIERMQRAANKLEKQVRAEAEAVKAKCGAKDSAPEPAHTAQEQTPAQDPAQTSASASARTESETAQEQTSASASARTESETAQEQTSASASARTESAEPQAEPAEAETPELAVSLLRQQFGIPAVKEDRDEEQQRRSMELNRAVMAMIRDITRNASAHSLADLKSDMEKKEFIRRSLTLAYDGQKFEEKPF